MYKPKQSVLGPLVSLDNQSNIYSKALCYFLRPLYSRTLQCLHSNPYSPSNGSLKGYATPYRGPQPQDPAFTLNPKGPKPQILKALSSKGLEPQILKAPSPKRPHPTGNPKLETPKGPTSETLKAKP